jgi:hypothetical protein
LLNNNIYFVKGGAMMMKTTYICIIFFLSFFHCVKKDIRSDIHLDIFINPSNRVTVDDLIEVDGEVAQLNIESNSSHPYPGYYLHIFKKETGFGNKFIYTGISIELTKFDENYHVVEIFPLEKNKVFEIYTIINNKSSYKLNGKGFNILPLFTLKKKQVKCLYTADD